MSGSAPEWVGWAALGCLAAVFGCLTWWLLLSPLPAPRKRSLRDDAEARRTRLRIASLVLLSGVLFSAGARWDELWHRMYGGFGNDFLWPPHLLIYGGLGLNAAFAGWGLARTLRGRGGLRERFRAEPLLGLLGLVAAYQLASIPSDLLWHVIIGPDLTAWSLPHLLLAVTTSAILLAGIGLATSSGFVPDAGWRITLRPGREALIVAGLAAVMLLALLQIGVTEWEWAADAGSLAAVAPRPDWAYAVVVMSVGIAVAHLALYATRWIGVATLAALVALVGQGATRLCDQASLGSGPAVSSAALVLVPAVALEAWCGWRVHRGGNPAPMVVGVALYGVAFGVSLKLMEALGLLPPGQPGLSPDVVASCALAAVLVAPALAAVGSWLFRQAVSLQAGARTASHAAASRQLDPRTRPRQPTLQGL